MKRLYVVRHCSAEGQSPDAPLTCEGRKQAERLSDFLKDKEIDSIISSPYVRAMTSIEPLQEALSLQVHADCRLSERVLSLEPLENWLAYLEQTFADFELAYNGGETSEQAMERVIQVVNEVLAGNDRIVVLVTHGNLMTLLLDISTNDSGLKHGQRLPIRMCTGLLLTNRKRLWNESGNNATGPGR